MKNKEKNKKKNEHKTGNSEVKKTADSLYSDEVKRLNRVLGQVEGVSRMLEEKRKLADILAQCKAVRSAVKAIEGRILEAHLEQFLEEVASLDKKKNREEQLSELKEFFKHAQ